MTVGSKLIVYSKLTNGHKEFLKNDILTVEKINDFYTIFKDKENILIAVKNKEIKKHMKLIIE